MALFTASLNSGSNGNCYYVGNSREAVLIDAGITCRETVKRMKRLGLSMDKVKAIFVSHEHNDHIKGVEVVARKFDLPVYITEATLKNSFFKHNRHIAVRPFKAYEPVVIGGLTVHPFTKLHDADDPHSFIISGNGINVGVFTDIGKPCEHVVKHFKQCHAAFLEANYDDDMLEQGRYPAYLKKRISGDVGHLSNAQALELFTAYKPAYMSHLFLSHISKENNVPELALELFNRQAGNTQIVLASRYEETPVFTIQASHSHSEKIQPTVKAVQASLF